MTKRDMAVEIAAATGFKQIHVIKIVQETFDYISNQLAKGKTLEFRSFGIFEVIVRKGRIARNPGKPQDEVMIPTRCVVKFRAGDTLRERVLKLNPAKLRKKKK